MTCMHLSNLIPKMFGIHLTDESAHLHVFCVPWSSSGGTAWQCLFLGPSNGRPFGVSG